MPTPHAVLDDTLREVLLPELELLRPLGAGGTAQVFLAREPSLQRLVAVKVLRRDMAQDPVGRQRFEREAQSAARISHPNVTTVYRVGRLPDERLFIVMEYVEGRTLEDILAGGVAYDARSAITLLASVASALAAAHARGIIHRDLRPNNVMVEHRTGRAVLGDFGIAALLESGASPAARLTSVGKILGDTRYLSPEQAGGESVVEQSDVYALGVLAFELLTGRSPYDAESAAEYLIAHLRQEPRRLRDVRPDIDPRIAALVHRCLAKDPNQRPLASEVALQLAGALRAPEPGGPLGQFLGELRRRRVYQVVAAYGALAIALLSVAEVVADAFDVTRTGYRLLVAGTLAGFPVSLVLAWLFDVRAGRVHRTHPVRASGSMRVLMGLGLAISFGLALLIGWILLAR